ncbi:MAG: holo-ACP synthase [Candidatus Algichlamydia australiensis]|nr:holo-ACP synthase [Chlamydiales bacterium]
MKGIGNDIIEIVRIRQSIDKYGDHFLKRVFTEKERAYCNSQKNSSNSFAGRFAAKEAISKALGCGIGEHLSWLDMEILPSPSGKPLLYFSEAAKKTFQNPQFQISISHCKTFATAIAFWSS